MFTHIWMLINQSILLLMLPSSSAHSQLRSDEEFICPCLARTPCLEASGLTIVVFIGQSSALVVEGSSLVDAVDSQFKVSCSMFELLDRRDESLSSPALVWCLTLALMADNWILLMPVFQHLPLRSTQQTTIHSHCCQTEARNLASIYNPGMTEAFDTLNQPLPP